jgi:hypothetical protein
MRVRQKCPETSVSGASGVGHLDTSFLVTINDQTSYISQRLELLFSILGLFGVLFYWAAIGHLLISLGDIGQLFFLNWASTPHFLTIISICIASSMYILTRSTFQIQISCPHSCHFLLLVYCIVYANTYYCYGQTYRAPFFPLINKISHHEC